MPFIVTTKRPRTRKAWPDKPSYALSRVAVATLEEAHEAARELCLYVPGSVDVIADAVRDVFALPESGGTVGPLPDGTVIEVESLPWFRLAIAAEMLSAWQQGADTPWVEKTKAEIVAAFNARAGQRREEGQG